MRVVLPSVVKRPGVIRPASEGELKVAGYEIEVVRENIS